MRSWQPHVCGVTTAHGAARMDGAASDGRRLFLLLFSRPDLQSRGGKQGNGDWNLLRALRPEITTITTVPYSVPRPVAGRRLSVYVGVGVGLPWAGLVGLALPPPRLAKGRRLHRELAV